MSSFRDTFTKEQKKDNLLDYDDSAFLFFAAAVLCCVLVPWSLRLASTVLWPDRHDSSKSSAGTSVKFCQCSHCVTQVEVLKKEQLRMSNRLNWRVFAQFFCVIALWGVFIRLALQCTLTREIHSFDPFEILEIPAGATDKQIKKAYRVMSLKFHPDKNPNDPTAGAKFVMISKAYQSLTDEVSKRNFEKFGNPDGPGVMKVGIGLPRFLVEEEFQLFFLLLFFTLLLVVIPLVFIWYYRRQQRYAPNGVQMETLQFLSAYMNENTRLKNGPELLAASAESRELPLRPSDNDEMALLTREVVEPRKRVFKLPIIVRNYFLILGHMQHLHHSISPTLKRDLETILSKSDLVVSSIVEIALISSWFLCAQSMLDFQRSLFQALGFRNSSLLQIPHFDEDVLKQFQRGKSSARDLTEFIKQSNEVRKSLTKMNDLQIADIADFCAHVSDMELTAKVYVDDENDMVVGDIATVKVQLARQNLREGESIGPIHAPLFPGVKYEQWWICVTDKTSGGLLGFARSRCLDRLIEEKIQFPIRKAGKQEIVVTCMCDSYSGIDRTVEVAFKVFTEKELKREVVVHPEDEALDNEPTLFQQMLGQLEGEEDSSDEEEVQENEIVKNQEFPTIEDSAKTDTTSDGAEEDTKSD